MRAPSGTILCERFPGVDDDVEILERCFEGVLESLLLTSNSSFSLAEFAVEELLG